MFHQQNRYALGEHVLHHLKNLVHHDGRQAHGRLVHQQYLGAAHQRAAHGQHLLLAAGHGASQLVAALFEAGKDGKHLVDVGLNTGFVVPDVGAHLQVFNDGHAGKHAAPFGHHGQALLDQVPRTLALDAFSQVLDIAAVERQGAGNGLHGGGLARTIGANERDQLAFGHLKINPLDGLDAAIRDLEIGYFEQNFAGHVLSWK